MYVYMHECPMTEVLAAGSAVRIHIHITYAYTYIGSAVRAMRSRNTLW